MDPAIHRHFPIKVLGFNDAVNQYLKASDTTVGILFYLVYTSAI